MMVIAITHESRGARSTLRLRLDSLCGRSLRIFRTYCTYLYMVHVSYLKPQLLYRGRCVEGSHSYFAACRCARASHDTLTLRYYSTIVCIAVIRNGGLYCTNKHVSGTKTLGVRVGYVCSNNSYLTVGVLKARRYESGFQAQIFMTLSCVLPSDSSGQHKLKPRAGLFFLPLFSIRFVS